MKITIEIDDNVSVKALGETEKSDRHTYSDHARWFDAGCVRWVKNSEYNKIFLIQSENHCNDLLRRKGYLFLNEVYNVLGIPRSEAGQLVGWIYKDDSYVDFGLCADNPITKDFIDGYRNDVILDFNVDGVILDKIF